MLCGSLDGGGHWRRMDTCICVAELIGYTPIQNKKLKKKKEKPSVGRLKGKKTLSILITQKVSISEGIEDISEAGNIILILQTKTMETRRKIK